MVNRLFRAGRIMARVSLSGLYGPIMGLYGEIHYTFDYTETWRNWIKFSHNLHGFTAFMQNKTVYTYRILSYMVYIVLCLSILIQFGHDFASLEALIYKALRGIYSLYTLQTVLMFGIMQIVERALNGAKMDDLRREKRTWKRLSKSLIAWRL